MLFRLIAWSAVYALPTLLAAYPLVEYDTGWHLATGRWIVENHAIPHHDPFSTVPADRPWIAYSWLFGVFLYGVHGLLGLEGILWFRTLMGLAIVASLHRFVARRQPNHLLAAAIVAAAALALSRVLVGERPGLFSILFSLWTLEAVEQISGRGTDSTKPWMIWLLPLVYVLWANLHIQFVHGLFVLGLGWLGMMSGEWRVASGEQEKSAEALRSSLVPRPSPLIPMTGLIACCVLATLINPYHYHLYDVVLNYAGQSATFDLFAELKSLEFRHYSDWVILAMFAAACFVLGRRRSLGIYEPLLLAGTAYFSFHSTHDCWLVVLATTVIVAQRSGAGQEPGNRGTRLSWTESFLITSLILLIFTAISFSPPDNFLEKSWDSEFPVEAARVLAEKELPGPIYNPIHWGGYLIWRLPGYRVSIDGRAQLQGEERIRRSYAVEHGLPGWHDDPDLLAAGTVVVERNCPLAELLRQDNRFGLVHEDELALVFTNYLDKKRP